MSTVKLSVKDIEEDLENITILQKNIETWKAVKTKQESMKQYIQEQINWYQTAINNILKRNPKLKKYMNLL